MIRVGILSSLRNLTTELESALPHVRFREINLPEEMEELKQQEILIADFDLLAPHIYDLKYAKWVQGTWAGIDALRHYIRKDEPPSFTVTRSSNFGPSIFEYIVANIINSERNLFEFFEDQKQQIWKEHTKINYNGGIGRYRTLSELTVGILGTGTIGDYVGNRLDSLGVRVLGYGRSVKSVADKSHLRKYFANPNLPELLRECDYIVNVLPKTAETDGLLDGNVLEGCKEKRSIFINVGRSNVISEANLIDALKKKWIRAAFLDVFDTEPLPKSSLLWTMPQVHITPHIAGVTRPEDVAKGFSENLKRFMKGESLLLTVDFDKGY